MTVPVHPSMPPLGSLGLEWYLCFFEVEVPPWFEEGGQEVLEKKGGSEKWGSALCDRHASCNTVEDGSFLHWMWKPLDVMAFDLTETTIFLTMTELVIERTYYS